jgi:hypothetical protein
MQRSFEDRLVQRLVDIDDFQRQTATSTDASLHRVQTNMQHLSGSLLDILMIVQRLEDKLDRLAGGDSDWRTSSPHGSGGGSPAYKRPANRRSRSRGDASESSYEGLKRAQAATAQKVTVTRRDFTSDKFAMQCRQVSSRGSQAEVYTRAARATPKAEDNHNSEQRKTSDIVHNIILKKDMPLEVVLPARKQEAEALNASAQPPDSPEETQLSLDTKIGDIDKKLERIAVAVGVKVGGQEGDDEEDRRRLKEKLKVAIELDRRNRVRTIVSSREVWLEYIFGICAPDKRVGKRGSRYFNHSSDSTFIL